MKNAEKVYSGVRSIWKGLRAILAVYGVSVGIALPSGYDAFVQDWPTVVLAMAVGLFEAGRNVWKQRKRWGNPIAELKSLFGALFVLAIATSLTGCQLLGGPGSGGPFRPGAGDHSRTEVTFQERTPDGTELDIGFTATGESALTAELQYTGPTTKEVTKPFDLRIDGQGDVSSPQAMPVAEGYGALLEQTPDTLSGLAEQIISVYEMPGIGQSDGGGDDGLRRTIIDMLIDRFIGNVQDGAEGEQKSSSELLEDIAERP